MKQFPRKAFETIDEVLKNCSLLEILIVGPSPQSEVSAVLQKLKVIFLE